MSIVDVKNAINRIKRMGEGGRKRHACIGPQKADLTMAGCAIIEGISSFWPMSEISVADRGIREGILLDMMHNKHNNQRKRLYYRKKHNGKNYNEGKKCSSN